MLYTSVRTQIYLPRKLREKIDRARRATGESLAEYLRKAAKERVEKEKRNKADLKKLADEVVGTIKKSAWDDVNIIKWQREIRSDREGL